MITNSSFAAVGTYGISSPVSVVTVITDVLSRLTILTASPPTSMGQSTPATPPPLHGTGVATGSLVAVGGSGVAVWRITVAVAVTGSGVALTRTSTTVTNCDGAAPGTTSIKISPTVQSRCKITEAPKTHTGSSIFVFIGFTSSR